MQKLKVSFNSPQCGFMSIGFTDDANEFHTTTAHAPHENALSELLTILTTLLDDGSAQNDFTLRWNRNPEEFDFLFKRESHDSKNVSLEIWQYPSENRLTREKVFSHEGEVSDVCVAFFETFSQMHDDRETDAFEQNWRQPFPHTAFEKFTRSFSKEK